MREAVERPVFHEEDFEREKTLARMEEDRMLRYFQIVRRLLLKEGPHKSMDWPSDPATLNLPGLESLWEAQVSRPWTLCVAGDLDREAVVEFARTLPSPSQMKVIAPAADWEEFGPFSSGCDASEQAVYALFFRAPGVSSPYRPAVELLLRCLNGGGGLLYRALRQERQLCYSAEALDWCEGGAGFVGICVQTSPEDMEDAADALEAVIDRLCEEGPTAEELERGRAEAASFIRRRMQDIGGRAFETARQVLRGHGLDFERRWTEGLLAVTAEDVREAACRYLVLEEAAELCIMPEDAMEE
jgi:zinc protease